MAWNYVIGLGLLAVTLGVVYLGVRVFLWLTLFVTALFPLAGKRHRHDRWNELNGPRQ